MSGDGPLAERDDSPSFEPEPGETRKSSEVSNAVNSDMLRACNASPRCTGAKAFPMFCKSENRLCITVRGQTEGRNRSNRDGRGGQTVGPGPAPGTYVQRRPLPGLTPDFQRYRVRCMHVRGVWHTLYALHRLSTESSLLDQRWLTAESRRRNADHEDPSRRHEARGFC
jgi:hypothetical protein